MAMTWKEARAAAGMTQEAVWLAWNAREMPVPVRKDLSRTKLQRLEKGLSAKLHPTTKAHLADLLGQRLSEIDAKNRAHPVRGRRGSRSPAGAKGGMYGRTKR